MDLASNAQPKEGSGRIVAVRRSVVKVDFSDALPALNEAIRVTRNQEPLILEVGCPVDSHVVSHHRGGRRQLDSEASPHRGSLAKTGPQGRLTWLTWR